MACINGLRLFRKNVVVIGLASKLGNRQKKVPQRIAYYYRFATQLNYLRRNRILIEESVRHSSGSTNQADFDTAATTTTSNQLVCAQNAGAEDLGIISLPPNRDPDKLLEESSEITDYSSETRLTVSLNEFNENYFIYRHVHRRLDKYKDIAKLIHNLPINAQLTQLNDLIKNKEKISLDDYSASSMDIVRTIHERIKYMNQQELAIILTAIKDHDSTEYRTIKRMIDMELRWLLKKHVRTRLMDIDLWFYLADMFYECLIKSRFAHVLVNYLANDNEVMLTNKQFLHLLFLVILKRDQYKVLVNYQEQIKQLLLTATFEDVSTICMAYFKTKTRIKDPFIINKILQITIDQLHKIDPEQPGYCAVIKAIRYSNRYSNTDSDCRVQVVNLITTLIDDKILADRFFSLSPYNAVQTVKLIEAFRIYEPRMLDFLAESMFSDLNRYRIKYIQYALTSLSNFAYKGLKIDSDFKKKLNRLCDDIMSEKRNDFEMQYYHLMPILRSFAIFGYYNPKFINYVNKTLSDDSKLNAMSTVLEFNKTALLFHTASRLEGSEEVLDHEGSLFKTLSSQIDRAGNEGRVKPDSSLSHLGFVLGVKIEEYYETTHQMRAIANKLSESEWFKTPAYKFNFQFTFPHQNFCDLIISKDFHAPGSFDSETLEPKKVPENSRHCVMMVVTEFDYVGNNRLSGYKRLQTRLFTKLGYHVIQYDVKNNDIESLALKIKSYLDGINR